MAWISLVYIGSCLTYMCIMSKKPHNRHSGAGRNPFYDNIETKNIIKTGYRVGARYDGFYFLRG